MQNIKLKLEITNSRGELLKSYEDVVNSSTIIKELKTKWSDKFWVDVQSVQFSNQMLSDDKNCNFYNIRDGATVVIISDKSDNKINLLVEVQSQTRNQKSFPVQVDPKITTEELMNVIRIKSPFGFESAYLTYHSQALRSGVSLQDQKVTNNGVIHVAMRVRGG